MNIYTTTTFCFMILAIAIHLGESCTQPWEKKCHLDRRAMDRSNTDDQISFETTAKLFNSLGMNKENSIAIENLTKKIAKLDIIPESEDIEGQIRVFDNGDGQIDVEEFGMMINAHADAIFDLLDENQDGLISIAEFKSDLDLNQDGTISKDEFMNDAEILASVLGLNL